MNRALIVGASEELFKTINDVLVQSEFETVLSAQTIEQGWELIAQAGADLVFMNSLAPKKADLDFIAKVSERPDMAIVVLVRESMLEAVENALVKTKALVLGMPIARQALIQSIKIARSLTNKFTHIQMENDKLKQKIEDLKVLDRAKCCLVAFLRMNEEQAHRYIQKRAMDMRVTQREVAEDILKTYEY